MPDCHAVRSHPQDTSQDIPLVTSSTSLTKRVSAIAISAILTTNYEHVHQELKKVGVTLKLLHEEYVERCERNGEIPMGKTKFNEGYAEFTIANRLTNHLEHKPGECAEVDWSGPTMHYLFIGTLLYSQYSYVEPCLNMKMDTFIRCHIHMYEYFGGVPVRIVCDNLKTCVVSHPKEGEIVLTDDYAALGSHYMTAIIPAGVKNRSRNHP